MIPQITVQLYSVREQAAADYEGTIRAIAAMGFGCVEPAGFPGSSPEQAAALFKELGLESPSCHGGLPVGDNKNKIMVSSSTPFLPAGTGQVDLVAAAKVATFTEIIAVELDSYEGDMMKAVQESYTFLTTQGIAQGRQ